MKVRVEHEFGVSAETFWDLVGDFGDMGKWTGREPEACVQEGTGIGSHRILTLRPGEVIIDRLDAETETSYSYSIVNPKECPLPFLSYSASMSVEAISDHQCRLIWEGTIEPDGLSEEDARAFAENMYGMGIKLMENSLSSA